jgi:DHA2 family multidrug resistance protein
MTTMNLEMDFGTAVKLRVFQSIGLAFLFVPINTLSYTGVSPNKNNAVSGLINLARNIGGSVGISAVTTLLARRSQYHQSVLVGRATNYDPSFRSAVEALTHALSSAGATATDATWQAYQQVYLTIQRQASILSYIDTVWIFGVASALMVPLAFLMKKPKTGARAMGH